MSIEDCSDGLQLDQLLFRYPSAPLAPNVFALRHELVRRNGEIDAYHDFIKQHHGRVGARLAITELLELYREKRHCVDGYREFLETELYRSTPEALVARQYLWAVAFEAVTDSDQLELYDAFLACFPDAPQVPAAGARAHTLMLEKERQVLARLREQYAGDAEGLKKAMDEQSKELARPAIKLSQDALSIRLGIDAAAFRRTDGKFAPIIGEAKPGVLKDCVQEIYKVQRVRDVIWELYSEREGQQLMNDSRANELLVLLLGDIRNVLIQMNGRLRENHLELIEITREESQRTRDALRLGFAQLHRDLVITQERLSNINQSINTLHDDMKKMHAALVDIHGELKDVKTLVRQTNAKLDALRRDLNSYNRSVVAAIAEEAGTREPAHGRWPWEDIPNPGGVVEALRKNGIQFDRGELGRMPVGFAPMPPLPGGRAGEIYENISGSLQRISAADVTGAFSAIRWPSFEQTVGKSANVNLAKVDRWWKVKYREAEDAFYTNVKHARKTSWEDFENAWNVNVEHARRFRWRDIENAWDVNVKHVRHEIYRSVYHEPNVVYQDWNRLYIFQDGILWSCDPSNGERKALGKNWGKSTTPVAMAVMAEHRVKGVIPQRENDSWLQYVPFVNAVADDESVKRTRNEVERRFTLYVTHNNALWAVDPFTGERHLVPESTADGAQWTRTPVAMSGSLDGWLKAVEGGKLWSVSPSSGWSGEEPFEKLDEMKWSGGPVAVTRLGYVLYVIADGRLWAVASPKRELRPGNAADGIQWTRPPICMCSLGPMLYVIEGNVLWAVEPTTGRRKALVKEIDGHPLAGITALGSRLFTISNGRLWGIDPKTGRYSAIDMGRAGDYAWDVHAVFPSDSWQTVDEALVTMRLLTQAMAQRRVDPSVAGFYADKVMLHAVLTALDPDDFIKRTHEESEATREETMGWQEQREEFEAAREESLAYLYVIDSAHEDAPAVALQTAGFMKGAGAILEGARLGYKLADTIMRGDPQWELTKCRLHANIAEVRRTYLYCGTLAIRERTTGINVDEDPFVRDFFEQWAADPNRPTGGRDYEREQHRLWGKFCLEGVEKAHKVEIQKCYKDYENNLDEENCKLHEIGSEKCHEEARVRHSESSEGQSQENDDGNDAPEADEDHEEPGSGGSGGGTIRYPRRDIGP